MVDGDRHVGDVHQKGWIHIRLAQEAGGCIVGPHHALAGEGARLLAATSGGDGRMRTKVKQAAL